MYEYKVEYYEMKTGLLLGGTNFDKQNKVLEEHLTMVNSQGWEFVSMAALATDSKKFQFEIVYRRPIKK